jgi:hypothetical protein
MGHFQILQVQQFVVIVVQDCFKTKTLRALAVLVYKGPSTTEQELVFAFLAMLGRFKHQRVGPFAMFAH